VFLDVVEPNRDAVALARAFGLEPIFETARMYIPGSAGGGPGTTPRALSKSFSCPRARLHGFRFPIARRPRGLQ